MNIIITTFSNEKNKSPIERSISSVEKSMDKGEKAIEKSNEYVMKSQDRIEKSNQKSEIGNPPPPPKKPSPPTNNTRNNPAPSNTTPINTMAIPGGNYQQEEVQYKSNNPMMVHRDQNPNIVTSTPVMKDNVNSTIFVGEMRGGYNKLL